MNEIELLKVLTELQQHRDRATEDAEKARYNDLINKIKLALELKSSKLKDVDYMKRASSVTCWGSLAYCCPTEIVEGKPCFWRDLALDLMGITKEQFEYSKLVTYWQTLEKILNQNGKKEKEK